MDYPAADNPDRYSNRGTGKHGSRGVGDRESGRAGKHGSRGVGKQGSGGAEERGRNGSLTPLPPHPLAPCFTNDGV